MDVGSILKVFDALMTDGAILSLGPSGLFVMLAGYQYLSAVAACARSSPPRAVCTTP